MSELLTERETALFLKVARGTLRGWRCERRGPAYVRLCPGKRTSIRYDRRDLERFIETGRVA